MSKKCARDHPPDDDDCCSAAAGSSSDDAVSSDDETGRLGRRLPRHRYPTVDDDESEDDWMVHSGRGRSRSRSNHKDRATYGVFWNSSDDDDGDDHSLSTPGSRRRRRKKRGRNNGSNSSSHHSTVVAPPAMLFVKGETLVAEENNNDSEATAAADAANQGAPPLPPPQQESPKDGSTDRSDTTTTKPAPAGAQSSPEREQQGSELLRLQEQQQRQRQEQEDDANRHFLSLLEQGRGQQAHRRMKQQQRQQQQNSRASADAESGGGIGLGFQAAAATTRKNTADRQEPAVVETSPAAAAGLGFSASSGGAGGLGFRAAAASSSSGDEAAISGLPVQFGKAPSHPATNSSNNNKKTRQQQQRQQTQVHRRDPNLGTWEKHTRGIGMKLLQKMGYAGRGGLAGGAFKRQHPTSDGAAAAATAATEDADATTPSKRSKKAMIRTGISQPVAVKVRPANLGLGFGNFKEATALKANRQIESEVRGDVQPAGEQRAVDDANKSSSSDLFFQQQQQSGSSSALPSVNEVMQQQSWKRQRTKHKKPARTFVPYTELLETQQQKSSAATKIIDLRGPPPPSEGQSSLPPPLAQEVLHNVSLLLQTCETRLHAASHFAAQHRRQTATLRAEVAGLQREQRQSADRQTKLRGMLRILDGMHESLSTTSSTPGSATADWAATLAQVQDRLGQLGAQLTSQEREQLQFSQTVVPAILGAVLEGPVAAWNPLAAIPQQPKSSSSSDLAASEELMRAVLLLLNRTTTGSTWTDVVDVRQVRRTLVLQHVLPRLKRAYESSKWDPVRDPDERGLRVYEMLDGLLRQIERDDEVLSSKKDRDDEDDHENPILLMEPPEESKTKLSVLVRRVLVHTVVYYKLTRALQDWKPRFDRSSSNGALKHRLDLWILPWLPHFTDDKSIIPAIVGDCKRKLKTALSFLQSTSNGGNDEDFLETCRQTLEPWRGILKKDSLQNMVSSLVTPRLSRYLAQCPIVVAAQDWKAVTAVLEWHSLGLLSDLEFLSLMEAELLPQWAESVYHWICEHCSKKTNEQTDLAEVAAEMYGAWRFRIFGMRRSDWKTEDDYEPSPSLEESYRLLRGDTTICACFYAVLLMIHAAVAAPSDRTENPVPQQLEDLRVSAKSSNYRIVVARRKAESKQQAADDLLRMEESSNAANGVETRVRLNQSNAVSGGRTPTFREVVEEYARERDILFQPRMGSKAFNKDGKQVFLFGKVPIYLDHNVAYAREDSGEWKAMSLDAIAMKAK